MQRLMGEQAMQLKKIQYKSTTAFSTLGIFFPTMQYNGRYFTVKNMCSVYSGSITHLGPCAALHTDMSNIVVHRPNNCWCNRL